MSDIYAPFGLRPIDHNSGTLRPYSGTIISGLAQNIFQYAPVQVSNAAGSGTGGLIRAPAGEVAIGSFQGVEYTLTADGRRHVANWWASGIAATDIVAYYNRGSPGDMVYEIQANGPIDQENVQNEADWTTNDDSAGSTVTGWSSVGLDTATLIDGSGGGGTATAGLRIIGFSLYPNNAIGDDFTIVQVVIAEHQETTAFRASGGGP